MTQKEQIGPRISVQLKNAFKRHLKREKGGYKGPLGDEVEKAIELSLAIFYLNNEDARADVPEGDQQIIERAIQTHSYDIERASEALTDSTTARGHQPQREATQDTVTASTQDWLPRQQSSGVISWDAPAAEVEPQDPKGDELTEILDAVDKMQEKTEEIESRIDEMESSSPSRDSGDT